MTEWFLNKRQFLLRLLGTLIAIGLIFLLVKEGGWDEVVSAFKQVSLTTNRTRPALDPHFQILCRCFAGTSLCAPEM